MVTPSSVTTIVRMTEPLSLLPLRITHKAKELPHPPHRVTLSSGEKGEIKRRVFSVPPPLLLCHPVAFKPNLNQPVPRKGEAGYILLLEGDGLIFLSVFQVVLSITFETFPALWGREATTHIPITSEFGPSCLPLTPWPLKPGSCLTVPPVGLILPKLDQGSPSKLPTWTRNQSWAFTFSLLRNKWTECRRGACDPYPTSAKKWGPHWGLLRQVFCYFSASCPHSHRSKILMPPFSGLFP